MEPAYSVRHHKPSKTTHSEFSFIAFVTKFGTSVLYTLLSYFVNFQTKDSKLEHQNYVLNFEKVWVCLPTIY